MYIYTTFQLILIYIIVLSITALPLIYAYRLHDKINILQNKVEHLTYERDIYYRLFLDESEIERSKRKWTFLNF